MPTPSLQYRIIIADPRQHRAEVELVLPPSDLPLRVCMPVWTPGSYLIREFEKHIDAFCAFSADGLPLPCAKINKNTWEILPSPGQTTTARYRLNAQELGVRQPYIDDEFAFFLGTNLCCFLDGSQDWPSTVEFSLPKGWRVISSRIPGFVGQCFSCNHYDELADTTILLGTADVVQFNVLGKPHAFVLPSPTRANLPKIIHDTIPIIEAAAAMFDGQLPYDQYLFILLAAETLRGGLEHRDSVGLIFPRTAYGTDEHHRDLMTLISHEFFHVWNVKRIHTDALSVPFDYSREHYTRDLWIAEGWTVYYEYILALRAKVIPVEYFLSELTELIKNLEALPGRLTQSLADSSFDTWIKLYRPDANSPNSTISYYTKGGLVACLLDLEIRRRSSDHLSLDDVMKSLWTRFGSLGEGYPEGSMQQQLEHVVGGDWSAWFSEHVLQPNELQWDQALDRVGLRLRRAANTDAIPHSGAKLDLPRSLKTIHVYRDSAAARAGLMADDEWIALDGWKLTPDKFEAFLKSYPAGEVVEVSFWRQGRLRATKLTLEPSPTVAQGIDGVDHPSDAQRAALERWLGEGSAKTIWEPKRPPEVR